MNDAHDKFMALVDRTPESCARDTAEIVKQVVADQVAKTPAVPHLPHMIHPQTLRDIEAYAKSEAADQVKADIQEFVNAVALPDSMLYDVPRGQTFTTTTMDESGEITPATLEKARDLLQAMQDRLTSPTASQAVGDQLVPYVFHPQPYPTFYDTIRRPASVVTVGGSIGSNLPQAIEITNADGRTQTRTVVGASGNTLDLDDRDCEMDARLLQAADEYQKCPEIPVRKGKRVIGWTWETPAMSARAQQEARKRSEQLKVTHKASRKKLREQKAARKANRGRK